MTSVGVADQGSPVYHEAMSQPKTTAKDKKRQNRHGRRVRSKAVAIAIRIALFHALRRFKSLQTRRRGPSLSILDVCIRGAREHMVALVGYTVVGFVSIWHAMTGSVDIVYIGPFAFLRSMVAVAWSALAHPFTETVIDVTTGRVIAHGSRTD
jgi:hypothetical protein